MSAAAEKTGSRKFTIEALDNGWLLKITESGGATFVGRKAYWDVDKMFADLKAMLTGVTPLRGARAEGP